MSEITPTFTQIRAGNTHEFTVSNADYPASEYTGKARIVGNLGLTDVVTAVADGDEYVFTFTAAITAALAAGTYTLHIYAQNADASERHDLAEITVTILPNIGAQTTALDTRSFAQKMVDELQAALLNLAQNPNASVSINGQSYTRFDISALHTMSNKYNNQVAHEIAQGKINAGQQGGRKILVRLTETT